MSYASFVKEVKNQTETLKSEASQMYVDPPKLDLSAEIEEFCDSLKYLDDDEKERRVKSYILPSVEHEVEKWQSQFSHAQSSLVRLHDLIDDVDREKRSIDVEISTVNADRSDRKTKHASLEKKLTKVREDEVNTKPITAYSKFSYRMFIAGSLMIGILTAWYYLTTQLQIQFAQNPDIIPGADRFPGTIEFLRYKPENIIYGLGVVMFLLAGKVISVIYEKLNHNNIFFLVVSSLSIVAIFGSVFLISDVSAKTGQLSDLIESEPVLTPTNAVLCSRPNPTEAICAETANWKAQRDSLQASVGSVRFFMTMIILTAEILLGSVAWMLASEHHERRMGETNTLTRRKKLIQTDLQGSSNDLDSLDSKVASLNSLKGELETIASQLLSLRNTLPTREYIAKQKQILIDQQIQRGASILLKKKHMWELDARSNS